MRANFIYVDSELMGYGRMGVKLRQALIGEGVECFGAPDEDTPQPVAVWASTPGGVRGWWQGQWSACLTMWEATRLPEQFRESMHTLDQILVPSQQNLELFSRHHPNVAKVRLGIDPNEWHYKKRQQPTDEFRFLIGGSGVRKGVDLVAKAYKALWGKPGSWGSGPKPVVYFKSPSGRVLDEDGQDIPLILDRMFIIAGKIPGDEERDLYARCHCYVQPSRGEGFGLQPLQAIAQGMPTILTDAHGQAEYAEYGYGIRSKLVPAGYFMFGDAGDWWEPDFDDLCDHMRWVYENYAQATERAKECAEVARRKFSWKESARDVIAAIGADRLSANYVSSGEWVSPDPRMFKVRVTRLWEPNVAGKQYRFEPHEDYWAPAELKRLAFERGILDPGLDDDDGLTSVQVERMRLARADHAYCPSCKQRLNSGRTLADDIEDQMIREEMAG